jgi:hypothetical protein
MKPKITAMGKNYFYTTEKNGMICNTRIEGRLGEPKNGMIKLILANEETVEIKTTMKVLRFPIRKKVAPK